MFDILRNGQAWEKMKKKKFRTYPPSQIQMRVKTKTGPWLVRLSGLSNRKVTGLIPSQGTGLGCRPGLPGGDVQEATD